MGSTAAAQEWGTAKRFAFRFVFVYLAIYNLSVVQNFIDVVPKSALVSKPYVEAWETIASWVGAHVLQTEVKYAVTGSGDTAFSYVQLLCTVVFAVVVAIIWSLVDQKRPNYHGLYRWLRVYVRYCLGLTMIVYGAVKVIKAQFPYPSLDRLLQPYGDSSPMGLLWTFMGASESYNIFSGAGELIGGVLVCFRRTALLGALVCAGVMSNVAMLNYSYDVPVKLLSTHLLLMAVFLCLPDLHRLTNLFLLDRAVEPANERPLFGQWKWINRGAAVLGAGIVMAITGLSLYMAYQGRIEYGDGAPRSPFRGVWNVEEFTLDGEIRPPLITDEKRWRRVVFDYPQVIGVRLMNETRARYMLKLDAEKHTMGLSRADQPAVTASFTYQQPEPDVLTLEGTLDGHAIRAKLRRQDASTFLLNSRGFHWISEFPFNR